MNRTVQRTSWCVIAAVGALLNSSLWAQTQCCDVGEFKSSNKGQLSLVQQFAYLSLMTKEQFDVEKRGGSAKGAYGLIGGSASYEEFRQKLEKQLHFVTIDSFSEYRTSWAQSALDANGLAAYRACLQSKGGFYVTVTALDNTTSKLAVDWIPGSFGELKSGPVVESQRNIANVPEITQLLGTVPWKAAEHHLEIALRRTTPDAAADITIKANGASQVTYIPAPSAAIVHPPASEKETWTDQAVISHTVPAEVLGGELRLEIVANAFSRATGRLWIEVYLVSTSDGKQQKCAAPVVTGSQNIGTSYPCRLTIPFDAQAIEIQAKNENADARDVRAVVFY